MQLYDFRPSVAFLPCYRSSGIPPMTGMNGSPKLTVRSHCLHDWHWYSEGRRLTSPITVRNLLLSASVEASASLKLLRSRICPTLHARCLRLADTVANIHPKLATAGWLNLRQTGFCRLERTPLAWRTTLKPGVTASAPRLANGGVVSSFPCGVSTHYLKRPTWTHCQAPRFS